MIRYLEDNQKEKTKELYKAAFPEDSDEFVDKFYYKRVTKDNKILVYEDAGEVLSMLQLNPYKTRMGEATGNTDYIVAVATKRGYRRQGYMRLVMERMLNDMYKEDVPWTWLMPANKAYYTPFDFEFIFDMPRLKIDSKANVIEKEYTSSDRKAAMEWMEDFLKARYDIYNIRDDIYIDRLFDELSSEDGKLYMLYNQEGELVGVRAETGIKEKKQRLLLCDEKYVQKADEDKPMIMARIVNLKSFLSAIHLKEDEKEALLSVAIKITDKSILANEGTWLWNINKKESSIEKLGNYNNSDVPCYSIAELTQWLFGYKNIYKASWCEKIKTYNGIWLDELV